MSSTAWFRQNCRSRSQSVWPIAESDTRLEFATILDGPVPLSESCGLDGTWTQERWYFLVCFETLDLERDRVRHFHDWVPTERIAPLLFPDAPAPVDLEANWATHQRPEVPARMLGPCLFPGAPPPPAEEAALTAFQA